MEKPCVLVVEDSPDLLELYALSLELAGFDVRQAANGVKALVSISEQKPEVIVTDLMMPEMDGLMLIKRLREDAALTNLPILVLSAGSESYLDKAQLAGATKVIPKPVDPTLLWAEVWQLIADRATQQKTA
jgi:CheY-like chemotaxis protein